MDKKSTSRLISPEMLKAYEEAIFSVNTISGKIHFQINRNSAELNSFLHSEMCTTAALITAYNPFSQPHSLEANEFAQQRLAQELYNRQIRFVLGEGRDAKGIWDAEPSLLALEIKLKDAEELAYKFQQNAFVWIERNNSPMLKLLFPVSRTSEN